MIGRKLKHRLQFFTWVFIFPAVSSNQTAWRKANLACKLAIDNMEKDKLLHGGDNQSTRQR